MKTRLFILLVAIALVISACGGQEGSPANPVSNDTAATATAMIANAQTQIASSPTLPVEQQVQTAIALTQTSVPTNTLVPTAMPTLVPTQTAAPAQLAASSCGIAADLGPWAPSGVGETFEVTCNETNCVGTHVQLWWPAGSHQKWEKKEISVFIPAGLSVEVQNGAGKGWEYPLGCSLAEIQTQIAADNGRRTTDTSFYGVVTIDELIKTGLVVVRFDRRVANPTMTATPK